MQQASLQSEDANNAAAGEESDGDGLLNGGAPQHGSANGHASGTNGVDTNAGLLKVHLATSATDGVDAFNVPVARRSDSMRSHPNSA